MNNHEFVKNIHNNLPLCTYPGITISHSLPMHDEVSYFMLHRYFFQPTMTNLILQMGYKFTFEELFQHFHYR